MTSRLLITVLIAASVLSLSACRTSTTDRSVSVGVLGAAAGAAIGSLLGNAGDGAVIGGIAGAPTGAVTDPCSVNLGYPVGAIRTPAEPTTIAVAAITHPNKLG